MPCFGARDLQRGHEELLIRRQTRISFAWVVANIDAQVWVAWSEVAEGNLAPAHAAGLALRTLLEGLGG